VGKSRDGCEGIATIGLKGLDTMRVLEGVQLMADVVESVVHGG